MASIFRLAKNTLYNISAYVVSSLVSLVALPFMLHAYGKSVYGVFMLASSLVGIIGLLDFGLTIILIKEVAQATTGDRARHLIRFGALCFSILGVACALILWVISAQPALFKSLTPVEYGLLKDILLVHAVTQLIIWPTKMGNIILSGKQRYDAVSLANVITAVGTSAMIPLALFLKRGPLFLTAAMMAVTAATSLALFGYALVVQRREGGHEERTPWPPGLGKRVFRIAFPVFVAQLAAFLMLQQSDRLVLGIFLGAGAIALYEVAAKFGSLMTQAVSLLVSAVPPFVAQMEVTADKKTTERFFLRGSRYLSCLLVPIHLVLIVTAPEIVRLWIGNGYSASILPARLLLFATMLLPLHYLADSILVARDLYKKWMPYAIFTAVLNVALSLVLVKPLGISGVALGTLISYFVDTSLYIVITSRTIGYAISSWVKRVVLPAAVTATSAALLVGLIDWCVQPKNLIVLVCYIGVALIAGYAVAYFLIFKKQERQSIIAFARNLLPKAKTHR